MRRWSVAAAVAVALGASLPASASLSGVPVANGNLVQGEITPAGDEDCFAVPLVAGGKLTVKVAPPKGGTLFPTLRLVDPSGDLVLVDDAVKVSLSGKIQLKNFPIGETGVWRVCVRGEAGSTGTYTISVASKAPKKFVFVDANVPAAGEALFEAAGLDGAVLSYVVKETVGPPVGGTGVRDPEDQPVANPESTVVRKGKVVKGKGFLLGSGFGIYGVRVAGSGTADTTVTCTVLVKPPKPDKTLRILGPEPRPTGMNPTAGGDGTPVMINGTGFGAGANLLFGDLPAVDVVVDSATQIRGKAPPGTAAELGLAVQVVVENSDGQANAVAAQFQYIGPPRISSVTPGYCPLQGGITHTVSGSGFRPGFVLLLGGQAPSDIMLVSGNQITFVSDPRAEGSYGLAITDEFDRTGTFPSAVTYVGPPTLTSLSPSSASFTGGRTIRLAGTRLRDSIDVFVDGTEATGVVATGTTALDFALPPGPAGTFDVTIRDEFGREATLPASLSRRGPFVQTSATAIPSAPPGADFFGGSVALGDVDGDGVANDLVVSSAYLRYDGANYTYFPSSWILVNDGSGTFTDVTAAQQATFPSARDSGQASVAILGDLDGLAGDEEILALSYPITYPNFVFTRNGTQYAYYLVGPYYNYYDYQTYQATRVARNDGSGAFTDATAAAVPSSGSGPIFGYGERWQADAGALGDLDGDSKPDLFLASGYFVAQGSEAYRNTPGSVTYIYESYVFHPASRFLVGDGSGAFTAGASLPGPYYFAKNYGGYTYYFVAEDFSGHAVALGDLDGDTDVDAVVTRVYPRYVYYYNPTTKYAYYYYADATRILTNDGAGNFSWDPLRIPLAYAITNPGSYDYWQGASLALGDFDDDGDRDVVIGRTSASYFYDSSSSTYRIRPAIRILANDGSGRFSEATGAFLPAASFRTGSSDTILSAQSVQVGDLDGDAKDDLVVAGTIYYVYDAGTGYGYFGLIPSGPIVSTKVLINDGKGKLQNVTQQWLPAPVNGDQFQAQDAALGDLDGDGDADLVLVLDGNPYVSGQTTDTNRPVRVFETE